MGDWRLIGLEEQDDSFLKMATEEAIMKSVREKSVPPTLRFYAWSKSAVALGFFQEARKELNTSACEKDSIEIFRRITGGGAVYKSPNNEINYSFIVREDELMIPKDVEESYKLICGAVITGLKKMGINAIFKPINDITLNGKKFSGNAQTRIDNVLLHHGTILLKADAEKMFKYLKIDDKKLLEKKVTSARELVTGLLENNEKVVVNDFVVNDFVRELQEKIVLGFEETFKKKFVESALTEKELADSKILYKKYSDDSFISWR